jgi:SNF2 family DNA or RNA helicase
VNIDTDNENSNYVISGDITELLNNRRLLFSLKRLDYTESDSNLLIPFLPATKIKTLQEIQDLLAKFGYDQQLSEDAQKDVESFTREKDNFQIFSSKAEDIRNNNFQDKPELVAEFDNFQKILSETLVRKLYPLQLLSAYHMAFAQNACNFAVPGAGKTSIVYGAYAYLKSLPIDDPKHVDNLLVIGPLSSFAPWEKEYEKCFGRAAEVQRLSGDSKITHDQKAQHLYSGSPSELTLVFTGGVSGLQDDIIDFLKRNKTMVVVDEAHRIKNPDGLWGKSSVEIAKEAKARVILTGTPAPNGYEDLFNLYQFLYPYKYKDILKFHYENLVDMSKIGLHDTDRVQSFINNISPYFIRIKKKDLKLPPTEDHIVVCEMDQAQREIYDFIETKYIKNFEHDSYATVKNVLNKARLIRLRQASSNPALLEKPISETLTDDDYETPALNQVKLPDEFQTDSEILTKIKNYSRDHVPQKFLATEKVLRDHILPQGEKAIIWTIFIQNAKQLQQYLDDRGIKSKLLIGEVDQADREIVIDKFNNPANMEFQVVIANPFSVAESISLHNGCHNAIYMERDYNCANFLQSKDRIHRVGLPDDQETNYYYILSKDSIDGVINDSLDKKVERMEKIIDEDIPLFNRLDDEDETDLIKALLEDYARRT